MDFGPSRAAGRSEGPLTRADFELDMQLLGGRRHRLPHRIKGRDVRPLLPRIPLKVSPGDWVFAVLPAGKSWRRVCWRSARITAITPEGASVVTEEGRRFAAVVPALVGTQRRGRLHVGQVVRVHSGRALPFGRVSGLGRGEVLVRTPWLGRSRVVSARRQEVLPVGKGLSRGAPVVYRVHSLGRLGALVVSENKYRWVLGAEGVLQRLPWHLVTPVPISRRYSPGDRVLAAMPKGLKLVSVTRALAQHVLYEVSWTPTQRDVVPFSQMAPP